MKRTIELTRIAVDGDTVKYEIHDNTGLGLLRKEKVEAQIQFHNADAFGNIFLPYRTHIVIHRQYSLS